MAKSLSIQERRTGAIGAYWGPAGSIMETVASKVAPQRIRTFCQTKWDEIIYALQLLHQVTDAAVVVHGGQGCSAVKHWLHAFEGAGASVISSNLNEDDSIMGGGGKLEQAIAKANRRRPKVIFVVTTPIVAINNDDIQSVSADLSRELDIPIVPIYADGFKSKIAANGRDTVLHALANYLIPETDVRDEHQVNIVTATESRRDAIELERLVRSLGLEANVFPRFGGVAALEKSAHAAASIGAGLESQVLGEWLAENRNVPLNSFAPPLGVKATSDWLTALGKLFNRRKLAAQSIERQINEVLDGKGGLPDIKGLNIYISGEPITALGLAGLVQEFGAKVAGLSLHQLDQKTAAFAAANFAEHNWNFDIHLGEGQPFEQVNILSRVRPDVYLGDLGQVSMAAKIGIPSICYSSLPLYGLDSAVKLAQRINLAVENRALVDRLASCESPYTEAWLKKTPSWYIKQEVR